MERRAFVRCENCGQLRPLSDAEESSDCEWGQAFLVTLTPLPGKQLEANPTQSPTQ